VYVYIKLRQRSSSRLMTLSYEQAWFVLADHVLWA
jgi:hypothetical protein